MIEQLSIVLPGPSGTVFRFSSKGNDERLLSADRVAGVGMLTRTRLCAVIAVAISLAASSYASAAFPGANGRIAFTILASGDGLESGVYTAQPDGSDLQRVGPPALSGVAWSADGTKLAYAEQIGGLYGRAVITTRNADGSDVRLLAHSDATPSFSPDGSEIVFSSQRAIHRVHTDGSGQERIIRSAKGPSWPRYCCLESPTYSPDGTRIAFGGQPHGKSKFGLWTMRPDGSHLRRLYTADSASRPIYPDISPDGQTIVFQLARSGQIYAIGVDGSQLRALAPGYHPVYSPAGDQLLAFDGFCSSKVDCYWWLITTMSTGTDERPVFPPFQHRITLFRPSWQPVPEG